MKKHIICFFAVLFFLSANSYAQGTQEYKTQLINGVEYYLYTVKPSEGLYRISVNFGVPQAELIETNPEIKDGLKSGQVILIPTGKKNSTAASVPVQTKPTENKTAKTTKTTKPNVPVDIIAASLGNAPAQTEPGTPDTGKEPHFYYHKVEKQQTLYSLTKQYGVKQEDILKYNPQAASGIREGEVLRIPKPEEIYPAKKEEKLQEDLSVKYLIHTVEPKETLYSISKKYNVKINDIQKINPDLEVLSIGQELKIPYYSGLKTTETVAGKTTTFIDWDKIFKPDTIVPATPLRIAFLLPFSLESKSDASVSRFVEFYGGALKAISEAQRNNMSIDVYTYDTGKTTEKMTELFTKNPDLKSMDIIIGPAYSSQIPDAVEFAKKNKVKTLIPFTSRVPGIETNPYIFQFNSVNSDIEYTFLEQMFDTKLKGMNYIFADIEGISETDDGYIASEYMKQLLNQNKKSFKTLSLSDPAINTFDSVMIRNKKNLVIFNTERFSNAEPYFENLNLSDRQFDIVLLERYGWKSQDIFRPVGVYVAPFKPEYEMKQLNQYNKDFHTMFGWDAKSHDPRYDLWGYDLTRYFILLLNDKNKDIQNELELPLYSDGIQSEVYFKRDSPESGFINQQLYLGESQVK